MCQEKILKLKIFYLLEFLFYLHNYLIFHKPDKLNLKSEFNTLSPLFRRILANDEIFFGSIFTVFIII